MTLKFLKSHVYTFPTINPWIQKQVARGQYVVSDNLWSGRKQSSSPEGYEVLWNMGTVILLT